ncbi:MAG: HDIG domain-containing protein [Phycisphaerae bacterium]|nr:HDIG domain-containing protein [Phycisphaerae bacterium]
MALKKKKVSARRAHVRRTMSPERFARVTAFANSTLPVALVVMFVFIAASTAVLSLDAAGGKLFDPSVPMFKPWPQIAAVGGVILVICTATALYVGHYQPRIMRRPTRTMALAGLFLVLLAITKFISMDRGMTYLATGTAVTCAIVLTIAYDQRFAIGLTMFYAALASLIFYTLDGAATIELMLIMLVGSLTCCFSLKEIRTRMKIIEVATLATVVVFAVTMCLGILRQRPMPLLFKTSGWAGGITFVVGVVLQGFLPMIERVFGIATSMTLMDYSDANQPLLRKLAMDAPGTFSHSLLIGSIAEAAAEAIGANGLLSRVGAYYHDIGKVNKPPYFIENQMGSVSRHEQLSPAMSQLVIVGHVKDGIEIAKEFGLPSVLRQFIETHHGTTLIEYFYHEARKKQADRDTPVSETEFRYPGPKPKTKEAAIVMLVDTVESAVRSMTELTPMRIEVIVHNMAMKRLQDGQFDECDLTLRELSTIENSISKSLAAHYHGRVAYPKSPTEPVDDSSKHPAVAGRK